MLKWYSVWAAQLNYLPYVMYYVTRKLQKWNNGVCLFYIFIGTGQGYGWLQRVTAGYGGFCGVRGALNRGERVEWVIKLTEVLTCVNPKNLARKFADEVYKYEFHRILVLA